MMEYTIVGDNLQVLRMKLEPGEEVFAEAGKFLFKTPNVSMDTRMPGKGLGKKVFGALKRAILGESLFLTYFSANSIPNEVAFAGNFPGRIQAIELTGEHPFIAQKDAFLCATSGINLSIAFQKKLGAGFFGGEGFVLEKFEGSGIVFIHAGGDHILFNLGPGEVLEVDTGCIVGFDETVDYDIKFVGSIKTGIFGGEGLFLATLRGPGRVIVQSLTLSKLRREIGIRAHEGGGESTGLDVVKSLGGLLGGSSD